MMNIVDVYVGRDFYDYKRAPSHQVCETNRDDEEIEAWLGQLTSQFKAKKIPWYIMTVTRYEVGGEVTTEHYHNAHPVKEKIILNKPAKDAQPKPSTLLKGLVQPYADLQNMPIFAQWNDAVAQEAPAVAHPHMYNPVEAIPQQEVTLD